MASLSTIPILWVGLFVIVASQVVLVYLLTGTCLCFFVCRHIIWCHKFSLHACTFCVFRQSWVLHSTTEYASKVINNIGPRKPSAEALSKVAEELFGEFQATGLSIPQPFFMKAHRWSVFSTISFRVVAFNCIERTSIFPRPCWYLIICKIAGVLLSQPLQLVEMISVFGTRARNWQFVEISVQTHVSKEQSLVLREGLPKSLKV